MDPVPAQCPSTRPELETKRLPFISRRGLRVKYSIPFKIMSFPVTTTGISYKGFGMSFDNAIKSAKIVMLGLGIDFGSVQSVEIKGDVVYVSFLYTDGSIGDVSGTLSFGYVDEDIYDNE